MENLLSTNAVQILSGFLDLAPEHKMGHQKLVWPEQQSRDSSRGVDLKIEMI